MRRPSGNGCACLPEPPSWATAADGKETLMQITWKISKKRGYLRPMLTYGISLEEHEKALALPPMRIKSHIPEPLDSWQEHCYPGQHERADPPALGEMYDLDVPSHKGRLWPQSVRLPWREDNNYPEVEASFRLLREVFERELSKAYASQPMALEAGLESTPEARLRVAPGVLGERLVRFARKMSEAG